MSNDKQPHSAQTTGHAWDGDIQEFNNPLPRWWLWGFYATVVFAIVYWILYPAWPIGKTYTKGMFNNIEYTTAQGQHVVTHWNTRAVYEREMQFARQQQAGILKTLDQSSFDDIVKDPQKLGFAKSMAKVLFADNCQACHQAGGAGIVGRYPNLADDDWLWGGSFAQIENTIREGHTGMMPSFKTRLSRAQINAVSEYVLSLSGQASDTDLVKQGQAIFEGEGGCVACHTKAGTGNIAMGSANLTDQIWTIAKVASAKNPQEKRAAVYSVVENGVTRTMPTWKDRLSPTEIKVLALYVHELGGGK
ncbi:MAG: cytochrome-c oxidase, cbb3-type subunit III [Gammaproteobacteria bacterium]|nr:cytochrome-c oxidase, cbb3-type subunit III [Gammaproteobacteria bacterium]